MHFYFLYKKDLTFEAFFSSFFPWKMFFVGILFIILPIEVLYSVSQKSLDISLTALHFWDILI